MKIVNAISKIKVPDNIFKGAGALVLVGLGVVLVTKIAKGELFSGVSNQKGGSSADDKAKDDLKKEQQKGVKPSYSTTQYSSWADQIYSAGLAAFGTDEAAIYRIFSLQKNNADILSLYAAFGKRRLEFTTIKGDLGAFLQSELNSSEISRVNGILKSKGITYKF